MTAGSDDERSVIRRVQRDRVVLGVAVGFMALGALLGVAGTVGVFVDGLGDSGFGQWPVLAAVGSFITVGVGVLLHFSMRKAFGGRGGEEVGHRDRWSRAVIRGGQGVMVGGCLLVVNGFAGFFGHWIVNGGTVGVSPWVLVSMVLGALLLIVGRMVVGLME
ncbi:hypothetical protein [Umezawaea sp.]|uniref:hypothetical protein n=1 Tax=Umezawaea sp. TaxID=1955258 RepID=UPI002ECFD567